MEYNNKQEIKWRTELEIVDITSGELLKKSAIERKEFIVTKKLKPIYIIGEEYLSHGYYGTRLKKGTKLITWEVIPNPQTKLL